MLSRHVNAITRRNQYFSSKLIILQFGILFKRKETGVDTNNKDGKNDCSTTRHWAKSEFH